jgi:orotate phosphoribosyltransferase
MSSPRHSPYSTDVSSTLKEQLREILRRSSVYRGMFTLASGAKSDFYVDAKLTTSNPRAALLLGRVGWQLIKDTAKARNVHVDAIGGLTMGADWIALSMGIAAHLEDPQNGVQVFSVRKAPKKHGRHKLIEGNFAEGNSVVVVEDVMTTGGSTLQAIDALEAARGQVAFVIALVDREEGGRQAIEQRGYHVESIFTRRDLIDSEPAKIAVT